MFKKISDSLIINTQLLKKATICRFNGHFKIVLDFIDNTSLALEEDFVSKESAMEFLDKILGLDR